MEILITWTTSWIWKYLRENLKENNNIIWISKSENNITNIDFLKWDLKDIDFLYKIWEKIKEVDYIILNAWIWFFDNFENISIENHINTIQTNLISPVVLTHILYKKIKKWIIIIWSISSKKSSKLWTSYSASKFGIRWFAMQLKNEIKWKKVFLINPKIIKTNLHKNAKIDIQNSFLNSKIEDILKTIKNIISWEEKKFEIDL